MITLAGKIAIITGAASGIGAATARVFAKCGATLVLVDRDAEAGEALASELRAETATFIRCDISQRTEVDAMIAAAVKQHARIDILFNNAGIGSYGNSVELGWEEWERTIAINVNAIFYACHAALPHLTRPGGVIINTGSTSGLAGDYRLGAYNASKGAVVNYTRSLALDHAREGIRVNALCPGFVHTQMTSGLDSFPGLSEAWNQAVPMGRGGQPEEMANVVAFLASDLASYITGAIVLVDGGLSAWSGMPEVARYATIPVEGKEAAV
jgi:meso-butanediol dehydrogenase/(S,S)-butanediol dehydrogenase/diacetyl reductase